ncbi:hypothetical protein APU01nite_21310 [Alkalibacterium putridalgicola]|uniref:Uncharacterized protein n=1 Tax=Alkalibacterium putridalgicola TaxID=426703 RepID=A0ABQ0V0C8_9LACT|nr:hypothetical protein APU01nite_21310 [Alkalibacterium putridalgicola]
MEMKSTKQIKNKRYRRPLHNINYTNHENNSKTIDPAMMFSCKMFAVTYPFKTLF